MDARNEPGNTDDEGRLYRPPDREAVYQAYQEERFSDAYSGLQKSVLVESLGYFAGVGIHFAKPEGEILPEELIHGLALAASREVESRRPDCPLELLFAASAIAAVARLRFALSAKLKQDSSSIREWIAHLTLLGVELGRADQALHMLRTGVFDALGEAELAREKRRQGAEKTNAKKATAKESALAEGLRICGTNPCLSNEDLAVKIREATHLSTTIRTVGEWVKNWRRSGVLPAKVNP